MAEPPARSVDDELVAIASLQEPVRRDLYRHVVAQTGDVSRDQAATALGISRSLAAFHLDRLVESGLLDATYRRLTGRSGPGAGRPAKLYRRAPGEHQITLPPRRYQLAAELLAAAVDEAGDRPARATVAEVARRFGRAVGREVGAGLPRRASRDRRMAALVESLERYGYEPGREARALVLRNCPFDALADRHRDLMCGMNLALLEAVLEGMDDPRLEARPDPRPGQCCVTLVPKERS